MELTPQAAADLVKLALDLANSWRPIVHGYQQRAVDILVRHSLVEPQPAVEPGDREPEIRVYVAKSPRTPTVAPAKAEKVAGYRSEEWRSGV